jgi:hypothetical protein
MFSRLQHIDSPSTRARSIPGCFGSPGLLFNLVTKAEALTVTAMQGADKQG